MVDTIGYAAKHSFSRLKSMRFERTSQAQRTPHRSPIQDINNAMIKVEGGDVRFRYVIDMASPHHGRC